MNLAIISPNQNAYSETFIQAHKGIKADKVFFYYGGFIPSRLEEYGPIMPTKDSLNIKTILKYGLKYNHFYRMKNGFSIKEYFLAKSLIKHNIDVVLAEFGPTGVECMNVCKKLGIPLITHFHGYDVSSLLEEYRTRYTKLIDYCDSVVGVSKDMVKTLQLLGAPIEKTVYTPCGPNPEFQKISSNFNSKKFLSVGRFTDKKAPYYTILAFNEVVKKHPDAQLLFVGTGELLNTSMNLVKFLHLEENIKFLGVQKPEQIRQLMSECIGFIQHNITALNGDQEGTPVGIMEASLAGLPVISTYHAGIKDIVINEKTGLLVKEHDVKGMADNIIRIVKDIPFAKSLGQEGRKFISENFSLKNHLSILSDTVKKAYDVKCR